MKGVTVALMFSSKNLFFETPDDLFQKLDAEFAFDLDAAANSSNTKVSKYLSEADDSLTLSDWPGEVIWLNPPYGRGLGRWYAAVYAQQQLGKTVVMLVPARTDTKYFHTYVWDIEAGMPRPGVEVRFLRGRIRFKGAKSGAPFPSMVVIFRGVQ